MPYTLIKKYSPQHSHLRFDSSFLGNNVTWDTHFFTLKGYCEDESIQDTNQKQFIDIEKTKSTTYKLTIALNIKEINHPNIQK